MRQAYFPLSLDAKNPAHAEIVTVCMLANEPLPLVCGACKGEGTVARMMLWRDECPYCRGKGLVYYGYAVQAYLKGQRGRDGEIQLDK